jgi:hypothetical protein
MAGHGTGDEPVAGRQCYLMCNFLVQCPHLSGTVLERPSVLKNRPAIWAEKLNNGARCAYVGGNMFVDVSPANAYLMKMILHDWNDEECV